jgi:hypothetical protein
LNPFNYTPWTDVFWMMRTLPLVLLLLIVHAIALIRQRRLFSLAMHFITFLLLIIQWKPTSITFTHGFKEYFQDSVYVEQIRTWLRNIDPNQCTGTWSRGSGDRIEPFQSSGSDWPSALTLLNPWFVYLDKDTNEKPRIRLEWILGPEGHYGIEIGGTDMVIPKTIKPIKTDGKWNDGEYRLPVCEGAYVWYQ